MTDSIKHKINALLNKTVENGCTSHEAEAALKLATKLMTDYMIEEHELKGTTKQGKSITKYQTYYPKGLKSKLYTIVGDPLGRLTSTKFLYTTGKNKITFIIGYDEDIKMAYFLWDMLCKSIINDRLLHRKTIRHEVSDRAELRLRLKAFEEGWIMRMRDRLNQLAYEKTRDVKKATGTDLVLIKDKEVMDFIHENMKVKQARAIKVTNASHEDKLAGIKAAEKVNLKP